MPSSKPPTPLFRIRSSSRALRIGSVAVLILASLAVGIGQASRADALALKRGRYAVTATIYATESDGLIGETTSSGYRLRSFDRVVALPGCTESSCPWLDPSADKTGEFGAQTICAEADGLCWVQVISEETGRCAVAPVRDIGPLFARDNWWELRANRTYRLNRGIPAAEAARDGADLGFGPGISDVGHDIPEDFSYAAAIDIGMGMWVDLGLDPARGLTDVTVKLLWQAGVDHLDACGAAYGNAQTTDDVNLREGPSTDDDVLTVLPSARRLSITGAMQNGFYLVDVDGMRGWVHSDYARPDGGDVGSKVGFVTESVNFRAGPSTADEIYRVVPRGSIAVVTGDEDNGFFPAAFDGQEGWISSAYLDLGDASSGGNSGGDDESAVTTDSVNFRSGPSRSSSVIRVLSEGTTVTLTGSEENGFQAVTFRGDDGWVSSDYLLGSDGGDAGAMTVTEDLNLRNGPSTADNVLLVMPAGAVVTLTGEKRNNFFSVSYNGTEGWAHSKYLD